LRIAMPLAVLACIEEMAMTSILKQWRANIPTLWHAIQLQRRADQ
jgi:hypothetical protein